MTGLWSMVMIGGQGVYDRIKEWAGQDGYDIQEEEQERQWLGRKVEWGGIEGNNFIRVIQELA